MRGGGHNKFERDFWKMLVKTFFLLYLFLRMILRIVFVLDREGFVNWEGLGVKSIGKVSFTS